MITEWMIANPKLSIILVAIIVSFLITLVYKYSTDQEKLKSLKERQKELQKEMKDHKENPDKLMELQKEMMEHSMDMLRSSFIPMLITLIPIIIFFNWIRGIYEGTEIARSWIWYYIVASLIGSMIFRKVFKMA